MAASTPPHRDPIREFIRAFNERDLDRFAEVLHEDVELHSMKGLLKGIEAARQWATRKRGGVQQTIDLEQLYEEGTEGGGGRAVALIMRRWHWDEEGDFAGEDEMAWVFELRDHRIRTWRPFEDRAAALRAGGFKGPGGGAPDGTRDEGPSQVTSDVWPMPRKKSP